MSTHFVTESGAHYEIRSTPWDYQEVRRNNHRSDIEKRADGEWVRLINRSAIVEGYPVMLELASLSEFGPDDHGNAGTSLTTHRTTTVVTHVWEGKE